MCVLSFVQGFMQKRRINSRQSKVRHNSAGKKIRNGRNYAMKEFMKPRALVTRVYFSS